MGSNPTLSASKQTNKRLSGRFFVFFTIVFTNEKVLETPVFGHFRHSNLDRASRDSDEQSGLYWNYRIQAKPSEAQDCESDSLPRTVAFAVPSKIRCHAYCKELLRDVLFH